MKNSDNVSISKLNGSPAKQNGAVSELTAAEGM